jgi:hypothetical protein
MRQKQMRITLTWQFSTCGFYQALMFDFMDIEFDYPSFYCERFDFHGICIHNLPFSCQMNSLRLAHTFH